VALRRALAPVVENLVLLDRLLFLKESGLVNSALVPLFDPAISPRCLGLFACRPGTAISDGGCRNNNEPNNDNVLIRRQATY